MILYAAFNIETLLSLQFKFKAYFKNPIAVIPAKNGEIYVLDNAGNDIVQLDKNKRLVNRILLSQMDKYSQSRSVAINEENQVYFYKRDFYPDSVLVRDVKIANLDDYIKYDKSIYTEYYAEDAYTQPYAFDQIGKINLENGRLTFSKIERNRVRLFLYNVEKKILSESVFVPQKKDFYVFCFRMKDFFNFIYSTREGEIYQVVDAGEPKLLASFSYNQDEGGVIPGSVEYAEDGGIFFYDQISSHIYKIKADYNSQIVPDRYPPSLKPRRVFAEAVPSGYFDKLKEYGAFPKDFNFYVNGSALSGVYGNAAWIYENGYFTDFTKGVLYPNKSIFLIITVYAALGLSFISICAFLYLLIVHVKHGFFSLYASHVLLIVSPSVFIFLILYNMMYKSINGQMEEKIYNELSAVAAGAVPVFSGASIDKIQSIQDRNLDECHELSIYIKKIINSNLDKWNQGYRSEICKIAPEEPLVLRYLASSNNAFNLFYPVARLDSEKDYETLKEGVIVAGSKQTEDGEWAYALAPVFNKNGGLSAVLRISMDLRDVNRKNVDEKKIIFMSIFIAGLTLTIIIFISFFKITTSIKKLINATKKIRNGDYKTRVKYHNNNEIGELFRNFNYLAATIEAKLGVEAAAGAQRLFMSMLSHEIRTPLNAILGLTEIEMQNMSLPEETKINVQKIYKSGVSLLEIINDVLDISKMESSNFEIVKSEYKVAELINNAIEINKVRIKDKDIVLNVEAAPDLPQFLYGDDNRITQILNNLLSNAIKYTHQGSIVLKIFWEETKNSGDPAVGGGLNLEGFLHITVSDTGIGIKQENLKKIFETYGQVDVVRNKKIEGTGLGLSITKQLIERMNGEINVESEYGKGSVFSVFIPQQASPKGRIGVEISKKLSDFTYTQEYQKIQGVKHALMPYGRALVADDVEINLDVIKGLLKQYQIKTDCVKSGWDVISLVENVIKGETPPYDVIFLDHMMTEIDGLETMRIIRTQIDDEYAKTVPIIVITGNSRNEYDNLISKNAFTDYLSKPLALKDLDDILNKYVKKPDVPAQPAFGETLKDVQSAPKLPGAGETAITEIDGLNLELGVKTFGSKAAYFDVLKSFVKTAPPIFKLLAEIKHELETGLKDGVKTYAINVHGIKGAARAIFADEFALLAEALEEKSKQNDEQFLIKNTDDFLERGFDLLKTIEKALFLNLYGDEQKEQKERIDESVLKKLKTACENYEMDAIDGAVAELKKYEYTSDKEFAAWLLEQIEKSAFKEIAQRL
jgi:signal transduction histidine kinase/HPt (histidine-containing phosphotransfer) domain-containing protein